MPAKPRAPLDTNSSRSAAARRASRQFLESDEIPLSLESRAGPIRAQSMKCGPWRSAKHTSIVSESATRSGRENLRLKKNEANRGLSLGAGSAPRELPKRHSFDDDAHFFFRSVFCVGVLAGPASSSCTESVPGTGRGRARGLCVCFQLHARELVSPQARAHSAARAPLLLRPAVPSLAGAHAPQGAHARARPPARAVSFRTGCSFFFLAVDVSTNDRWGLYLSVKSPEKKYIYPRRVRRKRRAGLERSRASAQARHGHQGALRHDRRGPVSPAEQRPPTGPRFGVSFSPRNSGSFPISDLDVSLSSNESRVSRGFPAHSRSYTRASTHSSTTHSQTRTRILNRGLSSCALPPSSALVSAL